MFINTNQISSVIVYIDTLITINGKRPTSSIFTTDIHPSTIIILDFEIIKTLKFIIRHFRYAVVSNYSPENLNLIQRKIRPQIEFGPCFPGESKGATISGVDRQIKTAIKTLGLKPCETIFISGDPNSIETAIDNHLGTICWSLNNDRKLTYEAGSDFLTSSAQNCINILTGKNIGFCSEVLASPTYKQNSCKLTVARLNNAERAGESIYAGGRYFSTKDTRYQRHALSIRIINSKKNMNRQKRFFSYIMGKMVPFVADLTQSPPDLITRIPPKPGQRDRLAEQLRFIPNITKDQIPDAKIVPGVLQCTKSFLSQKSAGYAERRENVRGVFTVALQVVGKIVYVMDDVVTSGSTLIEACRILYAAGAKRVIPVAIAYHPRNSYAKVPNLVCSKCKGLMKVRCAGNGNPFYGCSNYNLNKCNGSYNFGEGVRFINKHNTIGLQG